MAQTGLLKAGAPQVAAGKIAIGKIELANVAADQIRQGQGGEAPLARRQGGPQFCQGLGGAVVSGHQRLAARASSCWRRVANSSFSAWVIKRNTARSLTS